MDDHAPATTLSERADALEEQMMHELETSPSSRRCLIWPTANWMTTPPPCWRAIPANT